MDTQSDYVVVGTGSAGAVVASRLSTDPATTVVALEAGPRDKNRFIGVPAAFSKLFRSEIDWDYLTEPQPELDGREIYWPRGKVLGGSSSMNAMMWVRGFASDYDEGPGEPVRGGRTPTCSATFAASRTSPLPGTLSAVTTAE
ncbi:dehydrogenase FAD flavoprotein GMC oxidoreductase [Mycobacterium tuberculosis]|nr:dehydrogenase FAD flavoprotein GMC oxidoreductase [Mycobacterium tuberculosis]